jgi:hypothetical protein
MSSRSLKTILSFSTIEPVTSKLDTRANHLIYIINKTP